MAHNAFRHIFLFQIFLLLFCQRFIFHLQRFLNPLHATKPNDRATNPFIQKPRHRNMAHGPPLLFSQLFHPVNNLLISFSQTSTPTRSCCSTVNSQRPRKAALRKRTPLTDKISPVPMGYYTYVMIFQPYRNDSYSRVLTKFHHLPLFLPINQVPNILHTNKFSPPILFSAELHHGELICPHAAGAYVVHFPAFYEVVKCFHGFFDRDCFVEAMDLKEVDVGSLETGEGGVDGSEDALAGETWEGLVLSQGRR